MLSYFKILRLRQWVKNSFVLAPLIFTGEFIHASSLYDAILACLLFCLGASSVYVVNDIVDLDSDRLHPDKSRSRPLASGELPVSGAYALLASLYLILAAGYWLFPAVVSVIVLYMLINLAYSFYLKNLPVIDIFIIALGFVLRVYAGAVALDVPLSAWMCITTLCLALFLASVKRRQELRNVGQSSRKVLAHYSLALVERYAETSATGALLFYSLFVMTTRPELAISIPFVLYGLFRYWYVVDKHEGGESPTDVLLTDFQLQITVVLWVCVCAWSILIPVD